MHEHQFRGELNTEQFFVCWQPFKENKNSACYGFDVHKMDKFDLIANLLEAGLEPVVEKILLLLPLPSISQFSQVCR